jgi:hypothetical protein
MYAVPICDWKSVVIFIQVISSRYEELYLLG